MRAAVRWWVLLRPAATGLAAAVLVALIAGVLSGHLGVWRNTIVERHAQDFGIFLASARHDLAGRSLYTPPRLPTAPADRPDLALNLNLPHTMLLVWPLAYLSDRAALDVWLT